MTKTIICCSCDKHYGGDALACAKEIACGTTTPCGCECHAAEAAEIVLVAELNRLRHIERAAAHYRFAGSLDSFKFLEKRGWQPSSTPGKWYPPSNCRCPIDGPKSFTVALAIELELALGLHQ